MVHATAPAAPHCDLHSRRCPPLGARGRRLAVLAVLALAGLVGLVGLATDATAAPHLVANLNTGPAGDVLYEMLLGVEHDGITYFSASDPQHGRELWRTDGTAQGTYRLTDLCPGTCDSGASPLAFLSGFLIFAAGDGDRQGELWRTDGAPGHETLVKELCPGLCQVEVVDGLVWKGELWLLVRREAHAPMLWRTDGTPRGTRQVADFCADLGLCGFGRFSGEAFAGTAAAGDALLLSTATDDANSLVRTDGTRAGTVRLHRFAQSPTIASARFQDATRAGAAVAGQAAASGPLFFVDGTQLWVSDGTLAGTHFVRDLAGLVADPSFLYFESWEVVDGAFYAVDSFGDWLRSDGTAAGTVLLARVPSGFRPIICHLGSAVFAVTTGGIWRTGGTPETTALIVPLPVDDVEEVIEQPDRLFIQSFPDLYISDGTASGTRRIRLPGAPMPDEYTLAPLLDGATFASGGNLLWRIDAAARSVTLLRDFEPADGSSGPYGQVLFGGELFFFAQTSPAGEQLLATDGTLAGTRLVGAAALGAFRERGGATSPLGTAGAHLFFNAGGRFWATDGTDRGTRSLGGRGLASGLPIAAIDGRLIFSGTPPSFGECGLVDTEPWISDGAPAHTRQILELNPFIGPGGGSQCDGLPLPSDPGPGVSLGGSVLFAADDLIHGRELFLTDGTAAGTRLVADINPATMPNDVTEDQKPALIGVGSNPTDFVRFGSGAFFVANDGTSGRQLWFSNGRRRGTYRVVDQGAAPYDSAPHDLVIFQGALYFIAAHDDGEALFRSDGTSDGTVLVDDLVLGGEPSFAHALTVTDGSLFFVAFNETTGSELWVSRGTAGSTHLVVDLRPGLLGSAPQNLTAVGGVLVFAAADGISGLEPWRSDGTAAGTFRLGDIAAGGAASSPGPFNVVGEQVLFWADDGIHGRELWALPVADVLRH
jgi:ELWxxDGT repeat protein